MTPSNTPPFNPSKTELIINAILIVILSPLLLLSGALIGLLMLSTICKEKIDDKIKKK